MSICKCSDLTEDFTKCIDVGALSHIVCANTVIEAVGALIVRFMNASLACPPFLPPQKKTLFIDVFQAISKDCELNLLLLNEAHDEIFLILKRVSRRAMI